jgi:DNA-directed RNA polymerase sigma subunit (sigma70/sigma32)
VTEGLEERNPATGGGAAAGAGAQVVKRRYSRNSDRDPSRRRSRGRELEAARERVRQIEAGALEQLAVTARSKP